MLTGRTFFEPLPEDEGFGFDAVFSEAALDFSTVAASTSSPVAALPFGGVMLFGPSSGKSIVSVCGGSSFCTITLSFFPSLSFFSVATLLLLRLIVSIGHEN